MKRTAAMLLPVLMLALTQTARAAASTSALSAASAAFAKIDDYRTTVVVHEIEGARVEDRTYVVLFKKPTMERVDVVAGPGRGSGIVWLGGDTVKGHRGGLLSGIHVTLSLHDKQVTTLRGDTVESATIPAMLDDFKNVKGQVSEGPGPAIGGATTVAVTLAIAGPADYDGVTREILYLSDVTHLPMRRERYIDSTLVKSEEITDMKTDVGLSASDFPW